VKSWCAARLFKKRFFILLCLLSWLNISTSKLKLTSGILLTIFSKPFDNLPYPGAISLPGFQGGWLAALCSLKSNCIH